MNEAGALAERLLEALVRIPSPTGDTEAAAQALKAWGLEQGLHAGITPTGSPWLSTAEDPFAVAGPHVLMYGHLDTVPGQIRVHVDETSEGPVLWGRGTVDAKGPLATFATVLLAMARDPDALGDVQLTVVGAVDEEGDSDTAFWVAKHMERAPSAVIIGEPSGAHAITLGYKGRILLDVAVTRDVTHGGYPEPSAADHLMHLISRIQSQLDDEMAAGDENGLFGNISMKTRSVTTMSTGLQDTANAFLDVRLPPGCDPDDFVARVRAEREAPDVTVRDALRAHVAPRHSPLVRAFNAALRAEGVRPRHLFKTGTSDMNVLGPRWPGTDFVVYGPGDAHLDHTPFERIALAELRTGVRVLHAAIAQTVANLGQST